MGKVRFRKEDEGLTWTVIEIFRLVNFFHIFHTPQERVDDSRIVLFYIAYPWSRKEPALLSRLPRILEFPSFILRRQRLCSLFPCIVEDGWNGFAVNGRSSWMIWVNVGHFSTDEFTEIAQMKSLHRITCDAEYLGQTGTLAF